MTDKYVPVAQLSQSETGGKSKFVISEKTLKVVLIAVIAAGILYLVYKNFVSKDKKPQYETRSEKMIAAARNNVKNKNNMDEEDFSEMTDFSDLTDLTEDMKNYEKQNKMKKEVKKESEQVSNEDFFDKLSEGESEEAREPEIVQENIETNVNQDNMMENMQPGGRMGPGMMGLDTMNGMNGMNGMTMENNQLAGIPEE